MIDAAVPAPVVMRAPMAVSAPAVRADVGTPAPAVRHAPGDPLENFNRRMFAVNQKIDRHVLRPAAMGYQHIVPRPVRSGLRHFFSNLGEPIVFANFVLQLKPKSAIRTAVRFLINSTIGVAGTIDVAKSKAVELPHRPNGLGDTLGFYGVKPGPYIFLPLLGPSDLRDLFGSQVDGLLLPLAVGAPFDRLEYQIPHAILYGLDARAEADSELSGLFESALDPYATLRSVYLQDRAGEIADLKGQPVAGGFDTPADPAPPAHELQDPLADPAASPPLKGPEAAPPVPTPPVTPTARPSAAAPATPARR